MAFHPCLRRLNACNITPLRHNTHLPDRNYAPQRERTATVKISRL